MGRGAGAGEGVGGVLGGVSPGQRLGGDAQVLDQQLALRLAFLAVAPAQDRRRVDRRDHDRRELGLERLGAEAPARAMEPAAS